VVAIFFIEHLIVSGDKFNSNAVRDLSAKLIILHSFVGKVRACAIFYSKRCDMISVLIVKTTISKQKLSTWLMVGIWYLTP
jgi:hypothetical protein